MPRYRNRDEDAGTSSLLFLAAGAVAGIAAGVYLANRFGGVTGLTARLRERLGRSADGGDNESQHADRHYADQAYDDDDVDAPLDDDEELFVSADEELEERVLETFPNDPILRERAVDIGAVDAATIELTGHVFSRAESDHAVIIARGTPGVQAVVNRLTVRADEQDEDDVSADYTAESRWTSSTIGTAGRTASPPPPSDG